MVLRRKSTQKIPVKHPSRTSPSEKPRFLLTLKETPRWYDANPFILSHYRPPSVSTTLCYKSWTYLHNESLNIHSHLLPALLSIPTQWTLQSYLGTTYPRALWTDRAFLSFHLLTVTICLCVSAHFHTFMNHSPAIARRWLKYDYLGIVTLILGDFVSGIYLGFYCERAPRVIYWAMVRPSPFPPQDIQPHRHYKY